MVGLREPGGSAVAPGTTMRVDLPQPLAPGQFLDLDIGWRFPVPDYGAGRMGRDGTLYEIAPVVSAHGGLRRRARLESRALHRGRRVLPRVWPFDVALTVPADYIVARTGVLLNPAEVLDAHPARPAGPGADARRRRRDHHGGGGRPRPRPHPAGAGGSSPGASPRTAFGTLRLAPLPTSGGTRAPIDGIAGPYALPAVGAGVGGGQPDGARCGQVLTASSGIRIPTRTSRASRGRSRAWSTR